MNVERLVGKAVTHLRLKWGLPKSGFIAGGAIANLVWEYVSGVKAKVNDIDVFVVGDEAASHVFEFKSREVRYYESYSHLRQDIRTRSRYKIVSVAREGMLNYVAHTKCDPTTVLESFDINATCVGYSLDESRAYYLPAFEEFLRTGEIRVTRLNTPAHTAIRLAKKARDLSAKVAESEFEMLAMVLSCHPGDLDTDRRRFKKKYADMYTANEDVLSRHFRIERCGEVEDYLRMTYGQEDEIHRLVPVGDTGQDLREIINKTRYLLLVEDILFYFRGVQGQPGLEEVWFELVPFFKSKDYIDPSDPQLREKASRVAEIIRACPGSIPMLSGHTLDEQHKVVTSVMERVGGMFDARTAMAVLETKRINPVHEIDDFEAQLLGLSVRRMVHDPEYLPF